MSTRIGGILLAAGESRRMGYPKPLLKLDDGRTFLETAVQAMLPAVDALVIVVGAYSERVEQAVPADDRITVVRNPDYARGQLSSLKVGLAATADTAGAVIVQLADHPLVKPSTFRAVIEEYEHSAKPIVIARYNGRRGHPVVFAKTVFAELMNAPEDAGARVVVNADPSRVAYVDVEDSGVVMDLDTPSDLERAGLPAPPTAD